MAHVGRNMQQENNVYSAAWNPTLIVHEKRMRRTICTHVGQSERFRRFDDLQ